jgi:hypothetical protein
MCEFCNVFDKVDRDSKDPHFAGFFSAAAIDAAVAQAKAQREERQNQRAARRQLEDVATESDGGNNNNGDDGRPGDATVEGNAGNEDDDGT